MNKAHPHINPTMIPCKSSQIKAHGHDPVTNTLVIHFHNGGEYHYAGVSAEKYADLARAESVGSYLHAHVKGTHDYKKIEKKA